MCLIVLDDQSNNSYISASSSAAENTGNPTDFLSNGVKIRTSNNGYGINLVIHLFTGHLVNH